jgi:hypothetical protein
VTIDINVTGDKYIIDLLLGGGKRTGNLPDRGEGGQHGLNI